MNHHRDGPEQQTTTHPTDSTSMAAVASPLPEIRGDNMRGPANVQQRLPSLTEVSWADKGDHMNMKLTSLADT